MSSPARSCAYAVVRRVFEQDAYADRAFAAEAEGLDPRERALAMTLAYGAVQRRATLDHVAAKLTNRRLARLDPPVLAGLRLGLLQLLFLDGVAEHAAVNESVELVKRSTSAGRGAGLVNAVLRRAAREGSQILAELSDATAAGAALKHSVPLWLAELWWRELGPDTAHALLAAVNQPAESALRVNTLVSTVETVLAELPVPARTVPGLSDALVLEAPFDVQGSDLWHQGAVMAQSRGSMLAAAALSPEPGARALDLCAAPGGKATQLAAMIGRDGRVVAVEHHPGRAEALRRTVARMQAEHVTVETADATESRTDGSYQSVLVDPPCSGLGTLQSRPDLRWRTSPERVSDVSALQARILRAGAAATAPGGVLVYSVCTISEAEGQALIASFLDERGDFVAEDISALLPAAAQGPFLQTLPHRDGTDGFFVARLRRR